MRVPDLEKRRQLRATYKKGWEVRLVLASKTELEEARHLLMMEGYRLGRPFAKHSRWVQPVYGKAAVEFFARDANEV